MLSCTLPEGVAFANERFSLSGSLLYTAPSWTFTTGFLASPDLVMLMTFIFALTVAICIAPCEVENAPGRGGLHRGFVAVLRPAKSWDHSAPIARLWRCLRSR